MRKAWGVSRAPQYCSKIFRSELVHFRREHLAEFLDVPLEAFVSFVLQTADAEGMGGEPRAAILLENLQRLFPLAEAVKHRRDGADIERVGAQPQQVAGDPVQFGEDH